jgi:hypothetical protein
VPCGPAPFTVRSNRAFLGRAVRYLTAEAGIRQFLGIGTGIPTAGNTHQVAQDIAPPSTAPTWWNPAWCGSRNGARTRERSPLSGQPCGARQAANGSCPRRLFACDILSPGRQTSDGEANGRQNLD